MTVKMKDNPDLRKFLLLAVKDGAIDEQGYKLFLDCCSEVLTKIVTDEIAKNGSDVNS